jgi:FtsH-binding integral membrane protein
MENYNLEQQSAQAFGSYVSQVMRRVYTKMFLALLVTAMSAYLCVGIPSVMTTLISHPVIYWACK